MKILLINSGNDSDIAANANGSSYPPLGIISLATVLLNRFGKKIEVQIMDGQVDSINVIIERIEKWQPNLTGISVYCTSVENTILMLRAAKDVDSVTVIGNDHAIFNAREFLDSVPELDYVCNQDVGEFALESLVGELLERRTPIFPNGIISRELISISSRAVQFPAIGSTRSQELDSLPIPDRKLLEPYYWQNYKSNFLSLHRKLLDKSTIAGVATINRARGCARVNSRCSYCGIADLRPRGSSPEMFWRDAISAFEDVEANYLYEAFDSASSWPTLIDDWANARPDGAKNIRFFMYAQARESTSRTVDSFQRLGVSCVNIGFDSADAETLSLLKSSKDSDSINRAAARRWTEAGIEIYANFVLIGLGNESKTRSALDRTVDFASWLADQTSTVSIDSALLYPDRSSPVGSIFWDEAHIYRKIKEKWSFLDQDRVSAVSKKWRKKGIVGIVEACEDFAWVCHTDADILHEYSEKLLKISRRQQLNFGQSQGGPKMAENSRP
jgi:anaerobic magnesium-protoporphyrin IX monomethyl ester cyclase